MNKPIDKKYLETQFKNFVSETLDKMYLHKNDSHTHNNKSILDKISESNAGNLLFNGKEFKDGQDGSPGINGQSAYELAVENGFNGTLQEWLTSLKGDPGENGQDATNVTLESIGAASLNHSHGNMNIITYSTTEPTNVATGEIVMVYEE